MRKSLVNSLLSYCEDPTFCMLCGDLGFNALEPLQEQLGDRFINAGIAEQNMISVSAGLAHSGMKPWIYSISPFIYARAFEQIRNDVCLHNLHVCFIGSGAGYGYGINGPTHHALEDCGTMSSLQNMTVYVPSFTKDFDSLTSIMMNIHSPAYLRLGRDEIGDSFVPPAFNNYRKLIDGAYGLILALGGIVGSVLDVFLKTKRHPSIWSCGKLPVQFEEIPSELIKEIHTQPYLFIIEDHVSVGGLGEQFIKCLLENGVSPKKFYHRRANGYSSGLYGSQDFYRKESNLNRESILNFVKNII
ncbi:transketolase [Cloacibacillus porcorum]|uniref:transketolase family protein n=1 Tax=Cloacibacillus porcorum TaxID=1197717 RepID=UPI001459DE5B|nr:transketolase [Cloacibacillus porcorum]MCC8183562.1 hypothetical protein [Cloacibacillus porcorum]MDY5389731.1 hypothetical protein [Cloacibacillus porcorum]NMF17589.1 transketolase [Cloacibacillus porcorum]